jgi:gamma-glutamylcyclotransferase (GGCT)/AIG2-like uncharacterized protein YtfP
MPERVPLFVYGTLMRQQPNHAELAGAQFVRVTRTMAAYSVVHVAGYPALVPGKSEVSGELFEVDGAVLARLDVFEGDGYRRGRVTLEDGEVAEAYLLATDDAP